MTLRRHFPTLLGYPSPTAGLTYAAVGLSGLSPIAAAMWWPLMWSSGWSEALSTYLHHYLTPTLAAVHLFSVVPLTLAIAHGLGWGGDRLSGLLVKAGVAWNDARNTTTTLLAMGLGVVVWAMAATFLGNTDEHVRARLVEQARPAWPELHDILERDLPPVSIMAVGADPMPVLERLAGYPAVDFAYAIEPSGRFTMLRRGQAPERIDTASWHPFRLPAGSPRDVLSRGAWERDAHDRLVDALAFGAGTWRLGSGTTREFSPRMDIEPGVFSGDRPYEEVPRKNFRIGFGLSRHFLYQRVEPVYHRYGIDGYLALGSRAREYMERDDVLLEPENARASWKEPTLLVSSYALHELQEAEWPWRVVTLAALALVLGAMLIEGVRRLRWLWADRTIALAQSNFVSGVSHEMRTPLATIKLYAELLESGIAHEPAERAELTRTITSEVDRLSRLIENVLDFARISGRRRTYAFEQVPAEALVDEALAAVAGPLAASGMAVERHVPRDLVLRADRDALVQVLINLAANAVKYAGSGGCLFVAFAPEGPDHLALVVRDFGPGIPPAERKQVFRPFYRVGSELTRTHTGSGLGLALVSEHVKAHGGRVELEDTPGGGLTVRVVLPAAQGAAA